MSPAKTAEPIEMPFGLRTRVDPGIDGVQIPMGRANFEGKGASHCKVWGHSAVTCAKTAEPIVMPFGLSARSGSRNHELDGVKIPHEKGQLWEKGSPIVKYRDFLP